MKPVEVMLLSRLFWHLVKLLFMVFGKYSKLKWKKRNRSEKL
jgi:hypothetical protein